MHIFGSKNFAIFKKNWDQKGNLLLFFLTFMGLGGALDSLGDVLFGDEGRPRFFFSFFLSFFSSLIDEMNGQRRGKFFSIIFSGDRANQPLLLNTSFHFSPFPSISVPILRSLLLDQFQSATPCAEHSQQGKAVSVWWSFLPIYFFFKKKNHFFLL